MEKEEGKSVKTVEACLPSINVTCEVNNTDDGDNSTDAVEKYIFDKYACNGDVGLTSCEVNIRYIVFKGYTAKRKDEISLPLGTQVCILAEKDERRYVAAITDHGQEIDRGWVPSFCLQLKEEAVDICSIEAKAPEFLKPLEDAVAVEGDPAKMVVRVDGFPKAEVTWYLDGLPVRNDIQHRIIEDGNDYVLQMSSVLLDDEGVYTVKAVNTFGSTQCSAELLVDSDVSSMSGSSDMGWEDTAVPTDDIKNVSQNTTADGNLSTMVESEAINHGDHKRGTVPAFVKQLSDVAVDAGDSVSFFVEIDSDLNSIVSWFINNEEMKTNSRIFVCGVGLVHTMTVTEVAEKDNGTVKCSVLSDCGYIESTCSLRVLSKVLINNNTNPFISSPEEKISVEEDGDAVLNVEFSGDPPPTISWHKDHIHLTKDYGVLIETGPKRSTLIIPEVTKDDCGAYYCIAENEHGEVKASVILCVTDKDAPRYPAFELEDVLETEGPPEIIEKFVDKKLSEGDPILLQINISGNPTPSVKWLQNNNLVEEGVNCKFEQWNQVYRLFIPLCELSNQGEYSCLIENIYGNTRCSANISIKESIFPPKFFKHTNDIVVRKGQACQLDATIKAKPAPTVEWYKDNRILGEKNDVKFLKEENQYSLYIPETSDNHTGTYKCIAFNNAGESACIIHLKVGDAVAKFCEPLQDLNIFSGEILKLRVTIESQTPVVINWYKNGDPLSNLDNFLVEQFADTYSLTKENVSMSDNGIYKCEVVNTSGKNACECSVIVGVPGTLPAFAKGLIDVRASEYERTVTFEVIVGGEPLPDVLFYKDGAVIESSPRRTLYQEGDRYILQLKYALFDDAGEYVAVASNCNGNQMTKGTLEVLSRNTCPEFTKYKKLIEVNEGEVLILSVSVTGNPKPIIQWMQGKVLITNDKDHTLEEQGDAYALVIPSASSSDSGDWKCIATNTAGHADISLTVHVNESIKMFSPEFLSTLADIEVLSGETACFQLALIGSPEPSVTWKKDANVITENEFVSFSVSNGVYSMTVKDCRKNKAGLYECLAKNTMGEVSCSSILDVVDISLGTAGIRDTELPASEKNRSPKFLESLHNIHGVVGETIKLETIVRGEPVPNVKWFKQDKLLNVGKRITINSNLSDGKNSLVIANAGVSDCGDYECVAENVNGEASIYCEVSIKELPKSQQDYKRNIGNPEKPVISNIPDDPHVMEGEEIKFSFNVSGNPPPKFDILKNDKPYKPPRDVISFENNVFTFHIAESKTKDDAVYEITASNDSGKDSCKIEVFVEPTAELEVVVKVIDAKKASTDGQQGSTSSTSDEEKTGRRDSYSTRPYSKHKNKKAKKVPGNDEMDDDIFGITREIVRNGSTSPNVEASTKDVDVVTDVVELPTLVHNLHSVPLQPSDDESSKTNKENDDHDHDDDGNKIEETFEVMTSDDNIKEVPHVMEITQEHEQSDVEFVEGDDVVESPSVEKEGEVKSLIDHTNLVETIKDTPVEESTLGWVHKLRDMAVSEGEKTSMSVEVKGNPKPSVQFYVENKPIEKTDRIFVTSDKEVGKHQLVISKALLTDTRVYKCVAKNVEGTIECSANLSVQELMLAPEFITGLRDCQFNETDNLNLKVEISGKPKPLVEWYFNGLLLKPSSRVKIRTERGIDILKINECNLDDTGMYKVICYNTAGEISSSCNVIVLEETKAPHFIVTPQNVEITEGQSASFAACYDGKPAPLPYWSFNGEEIKEGKNFHIDVEQGMATLSIKEAEISHTGTYCCEISNECSSVKCCMELSVEEVQVKPSFTEILKDVTVKEGETVEFSVKITGNPKPCVTWFKGEDKLAQNSRFSFSEENDLYTLTICKCNNADSGYYEIVADNIVGESSYRANLVVEEVTLPPTFKKDIENVSCTEGETIHLSVVVDGKPKPRIQWLRDDSEIKNGSDITISTVEHNSELKIFNCKTNQSGTYKCLAQNSHGIEETTCVIEVKEALTPPVFERKPNPEMEILENDDLSFGFVVNGIPTPSVVITKNDKKLDMNVTNFELVDGHGCVRIPNVSKADEGIYKMTAENCEGTSICSVALIVLDALKFITVLTDIIAVEGDDAELCVEFHGNALDVDWYKDNEYIDESEKCEIIDEQTRCTCIIHNCTLSDGGTYRCEILNEKSSLFCTASLTVLPKTTKPSFGQTLRDIVANEGDAVTLSVIATGMPAPECKWFKDNFNLTNNEDLLIASDEDTHMLMFSSIVPTDAGKYRCELINEAGSSECEASITVRSALIKPAFTRSFNTEMRITEGNECILTVCVEGKPHPEVTFLKDGESIKYDERISTTQDKGGVFSLVIQKATFDDEGEYSATAVNSAATVSCSGVLLVEKEKKAPTFISKPSDVMVYEDSDAVFDMKISGIPDPFVKVLFNNEVVKVVEVENEVCEVTVERCELTQAGEYIFEASNDAGKTSASVYLDVQEVITPAVFEQKMHDYSGNVGDDIILKVVIDGNPPPHVKFYKGNERISSDSRRNISLADNTVLLKISDSALDDSGVYRCQIKNDVGEDTCTAVVKLSPPNAPSRFITELDDVVIVEGEELIVQVEVDGYPIPEMQWLKNGELIDNEHIVQNEDIGTFIKPIVELSDNGEYTVVAHNDYGEDKQCFNLEVSPMKKAPKITKELIDATAIESEKLSLEIHVVSNPASEVTWYKDDVIITNDLGFVYESNAEDGKFYLLHERVNLALCGNYKVVVVNHMGETSSACQVSISEKPELPKFVQKFESQTTEEGDNVNFIVVVTGKPIPEITWFKDQFELKSKYHTEVEGTTLTSQLHFPSVYVKDSGKYKCIVKNSSGEISHYATLKVNEVIHPPAFIHSLQDMSVTEGQPLTINIDCDGTRPFKVKWMKNGKPLFKSNSIRQEKTNVGYCLKISKVATTDSGQYTLELQNSAGANSISCNVIVQETAVAPFFTLNLRDITAGEGSDIELNVKPMGKPRPELKWFKNDEEIIPNDNILTTVKRDGKVCLTIKSISLDYNGTLRCEATNPTGQVTTSCKLIVNHIARRPEFDISLKDIVITEGGDAKLTAVISAKPDPTITWYKNQELVKESNRIKFIREEDSYSILIENVTVDDAGTYKLSARNTAGERSNSCVICVNGNLTKPFFTKALDEVNAESGEIVRLSVEATGNPKPEFRWEKDGGNIKANGRFKIEENDGISTLIINGTEGGDNGLYTCIASNKAGESTTQSEVFICETITPPKFQTSLHDFTVNEGEDIVLSVDVYGYPKPLVNFYKEKKRIQNIDGISIKNVDDTWSVLIEDAGPDDGGMYECKVFNDCGESFCACYITVNEVDNLDIQCVDGKDLVTAIVGSDILLEAEIYGTPEIVDWTFGDKFLDTGKKYKIDVEEGHTSLRIFDVKESDAGSYGCIAAIEDTEVEQLFILKVEKAVKSISRKEVVEEQAKIGFVKKGSWEAGVKDSIEKHVAAPEIETTSKERDAQPPIANKPSKAPSSIKNKFLKAKGSAPIFSMAPKSKDLKEGSIAKFTCNCTAIPDASITWCFDEDPIKPSNRYEIKDTYGFASLVIKSVTTHDIGNYKVVAENTLGKCEAKFSLVVYGEKTRSSPTGGEMKVKGNVAKDESVLYKSNHERNGTSFASETALQSGRAAVEKELDYVEQMSKSNVMVGHEETLGESNGIRKQTATEHSTAVKRIPLHVPVKKGNEELRFVRELAHELVIKKGSTLHLEIELPSSLGEVFWERDGEQMEDARNVRLGNKGLVHFLEIDDMQSDDEGDFEVFVEHGDKEISCMCEVYIDDTIDTMLHDTSMRDEGDGKATSVGHEGKITAGGVVDDNRLFAVEEKLKPTVVVCGETASFMVILTRPAEAHEWLINNKEITNSHMYRMETKEDHYMLSIKNCDMFLDKKLIQFIGYLGDKEVTSQVKLTVIPATPLLVAKCELSQEGAVGEDILLSVEVKGFRNPNIQWMKGFKLLTNNPSRNEILFYDGLATLEIKDSGIYDSGIYKCIVSEHGKKFEKKFNVKIKRKGPE